METVEFEVCQDGSKRDERGRRVLGESEWAQVLDRYKSSGLTQKAFCRGEGVNYHTFVAWLGRRRRADGNGDNRAPAKFHELQLSGAQGSASSLEVVLWDGTVIRGGCAGEIAKLVGLLREHR